MKIAIIGAGGHGRVVLDILKNNHQFDVAGFLDNNSALQHNQIDGIEVLGDISLISEFKQLNIGAAVIAIGDNRTRQAFAETLQSAGICLVSAIHPSANIADTASIGKNVVIAAGSTICTHVRIDDSAILNTGCIIDHESQILRAAHICPGVRIAGHVTVKPGAFVGIGATIIQGVTIGNSSVVGAGAVVLEDVPAHATVVGVPARIVKDSNIPGTPARVQAPTPLNTKEIDPAAVLISQPPKRPMRRKPQPELETSTNR